MCIGVKFVSLLLLYLLVDDLCLGDVCLGEVCMESWFIVNGMYMD